MISKYIFIILTFSIMSKSLNGQETPSSNINFEGKSIVKKTNQVYYFDEFVEATLLLEKRENLKEHINLNISLHEIEIVHNEELYYIDPSLVKEIIIGDYEGVDSVTIRMLNEFFEISFYKSPNYEFVDRPSINHRGLGTNVPGQMRKERPTMRHNYYLIQGDIHKKVRLNKSNFIKYLGENAKKIIGENKFKMNSILDVILLLKEIE